MKTRIDKGFCFNYWSLSYRRKFLRTIWFGGVVTAGVFCCLGLTFSLG